MNPQATVEIEAAGVEYIRQAIVDMWGDPCATTDEDCPTCQAWAAFTALTGTSPTPAAEGVVEPRTLDEWQESDGDVVWWCWQDDQWLGEPAYIGSPLDLGRGYELMIADQKFVVNLDGWPGYHTHWTPHPPLPASLKGDSTP